MLLIPYGIDPTLIFSFFKTFFSLFKKFFGKTISLSINNKKFPELIFAPKFLVVAGPEFLIYLYITLNSFSFFSNFGFEPSSITIVSIFFKFDISMDLSKSKTWFKLLKTGIIIDTKIFFFIFFIYTQIV